MSHKFSEPSNTGHSRGKIESRPTPAHQPWDALEHWEVRADHDSYAGRPAVLRPQWILRTSTCRRRICPLWHAFAFGIGDLIPATQPLHI